MNTTQKNADDMKTKKQKLYCYVDETGQDTNGGIFIVVAIIVEDERGLIKSFLEKIEIKSGKGKRKWMNTRKRERDLYLDQALTKTKLNGALFCHLQKDTKAYEAQTVITIEQAIRQFTASRSIINYKTTIVIDGLNKKASERVGTALRKAGVPIRKVRGERDESNAIIRLADTLTGVIREAEEGNRGYKKLRHQLEERGLLNMV